MPHDVRNRLVKVGDRVTIEFVITHLNEGEEYCNADLQSVLPMPPYTDQFLNLYGVNTHQSQLKENLPEAEVG